MVVRSGISGENCIVEGRSSKHERYCRLVWYVYGETVMIKENTMMMVVFTI